MKEYHYNRRSTILGLILLRIQKNISSVTQANDYMYFYYIVKMSNKKKKVGKNISISIIL